MSAQRLADYFGSILNKTVGTKPIKLTARKITDKEDRVWTIANYAPDADRLPVVEPVRLRNGGFLKFEHVVRVLDVQGPARNLKKMTTLGYSYLYSTTPPEDRDWMFRYEYEVEPLDTEARYPSGHLHVNAEPNEYTRVETVKDFPLLHLPTRRLSLEEIVWHLVNEHIPTVNRKTKEQWFDFLNESKAEYEDRIVAEPKPGLPPLLQG